MKKKMTVLGALLMAVVVTGYSVSGTYAKYTSTIDATSNSARVASWKIDVEGTKYDSANKTFKLFDMTSIWELTEDGNVNTSKFEEHMKRDGDDIIAPGMGGFVEIQVTNNGEVDASVEGYLSEITNLGNIPLEFSAHNTNGTWVKASQLTDEETARSLAFAKDTLKPGERTTLKVYWRWAYETGSNATEIEAGDKFDTDLATGAIADLSTVTVTAKLTATQID